MRAITKDAVNAFLNAQSFNRDNTSVAVYEEAGTRAMRLHGNLIAKYEGTKLYLSCGGWTSTTTKERLNGILSTLGKPLIRQVKGEWLYTDGREFDTNGWNLID